MTPEQTITATLGATGGTMAPSWTAARTAGHLLIMGITSRGSTGLPGSITGWDLLIQLAHADASAAQIRIYGRIASNDADDNISVTVADGGSNMRSSLIAHEIPIPVPAGASQAARLAALIEDSDSNNASEATAATSQTLTVTVAGDAYVLYAAMWMGGADPDPSGNDDLTFLVQATGAGGGASNHSNQVHADYTATTGGTYGGSITKATLGAGRVASAIFAFTIEDDAEPEAPTVAIDQSSPQEVLVGGTLQLTATVTGEPPPSEDWESSDTEVATVHPSTGLVTGVGAGSAVITLFVENTEGTDDDSITVNVEEPPAPEAIADVPLEAARYLIDSALDALVVDAVLIVQDATEPMTATFLSQVEADEPTHGSYGRALDLDMGAAIVGEEVYATAADAVFTGLDASVVPTHMLYVIRGADAESSRILHAVNLVAYLTEGERTPDGDGLTIETASLGLFRVTVQTVTTA